MSEWDTNTHRQLGSLDTRYREHGESAEKTDSILLLLPTIGTQQTCDGSSDSHPNNQSRPGSPPPAHRHGAAQSQATRSDDVINRQGQVHLFSEGTCMYHVHIIIIIIINTYIISAKMVL